MSFPDTHYSTYLGLKNILNSQKMLSENAHDEMLFIITHQAYELWFKQILYEIDSIVKIFSAPPVHDKNMGTIINRLERIKHIQKVMFDHIEILETMPALDFLEFRDNLYPASGFQSVQFRELEIKLGLKMNQRPGVNEKTFYRHFNQAEQDYIKKISQQSNLFDLVKGWLERMPFLSFEKFNFWNEYQERVNNHLDVDQSMIEKNIHLDENEKKALLKNLDGTRATFQALFDQKLYEKYFDDGSDKKPVLGQKATLSALFIQLYRNEPILQLPFKLLTCLIELDENFSAWRYRHAMMAQRMLGSKVGTGGSLGHTYLKKTAESNRVFTDLFDLSSFLIPRSQLPKLPENMQSAMDFHFSFQSKK